VQATAKEVKEGTNELERLEAEFLTLQLSVLRKTPNSDENGTVALSGTLRKPLGHTISQDMFMPLDQHSQLDCVLEAVQEYMPKCLDAIRILRDLCMHDANVRDLAGPAGAVQAVLRHCKSQESTNRSKIMAVEAISLLCDGHMANKKVLGEMHGVQVTTSSHTMIIESPQRLRCNRMHKQQLAATSSM
jgi:hypothetical protein